MKGNKTYHPFGYSHNIIDNKIYIPTRHYHQEVKWINNYNEVGLPIEHKYDFLNFFDWDDQKNSNSNHNVKNNYISQISSKSNNLKKLNDKKYKKEQNIIPINKSQTDDFTYKQIANDWSHSIYMLNINPFLNKNIKQMNSCEEIWDNDSLFDPDKINFNFGYCKNFAKIQIDGTHPNIDLIFNN